MIRMLALRLLLLVLICIAFLDLLERFNPTPPSMLIAADWSACTKVYPGPLQRPDGYNVRPYGRKADKA